MPTSAVGEGGISHRPLDVGVRAYDPALGRFLQQDEVDEGNPYAYAGNSPTGAVDPTGRASTRTPAGMNQLVQTVEECGPDMEEIVRDLGMRKVGGRWYLGHAISQAEGRSMSPSVVEEVLKYGQKVAANYGRWKYTLCTGGRKLTVITSASGKTVWTAYGGHQQGVWERIVEGLRHVIFGG